MAALLAFAAQAAEKSSGSATKTQTGFVLGAGTYLHPLPHDNAFDPLPDLAPEGFTIAGSDKITLLPVKIGLFRSLGSRANVEVYGRYLLSMGGTWTVTGTQTGTGSASWSSYGGGVNLSVALAPGARIRLNGVLNAEYVLQRLHLESLTNVAAEKIDLTTSSMLVGFGLQPELYLGDLWTLSLLAAYQYGFTGTWSAASAADFLGVAQSGTLRNPKTGGAIVAQNGGLLLEASLKLSFF